MQISHRLRRLILPAAVVSLSTLMGYFLAPGSADKAQAILPEELRPDLITLQPEDIQIVWAGHGKKAEKRLRFSNTVANIGEGPLQLRPVDVGCSDNRRQRKIEQMVFRDDNATAVFERPSDTSHTVYDAGCNIFHAQHHHWHLDNFATYQLKAGSEIVRESQKVSFCIIDIAVYDGTLAGSPDAPYFRACGRNATLGLSVGWKDIYQSTLAGQYIVITGLADGAYCLVSTADPPSAADPDGQIAELNETNNAAGVSVTIDGNTVTTGAHCS